MRKEIVLGGCSYFVVTEDGQVIFEESRPVAGGGVMFSFERPREINNSNGIWYFTGLSSVSGRVPASHIEQALEYCRLNYGGNFEPYPARSQAQWDALQAANNPKQGSLL